MVETRGCELPERRSKQQNGLENLTAFLVESIKGNKETIFQLGVNI